MHLTLQTPQQASVADGPILLELTLTNDGETAVEAPRPQGSRPFEYTILDSAGKQIVALASLARHRASTPRMGPPMRMSNTTQELPVSAAIRYTDDAAALLETPLAPGRYLLEAAYYPKDGVAVQSERVAIEVQPSKPAASAQELAMKPGTLLIVELHDPLDGSYLLRKRQSDHGFLGRFLDMRSIRPSSPVRHLSVALEADYGAPTDWRWTAWLEGESLFGGVLRSTDFTRPTEAIPLGLTDPSLLPYGYVFNDGSGLFVAVGFDSGQRRMVLIRIPAAMDGKAERIVVNLGEVPPAIPGVTLVWNDTGSPDLICCWDMRTSESSGFGIARVDAVTGATREPLRGVFRTNRKLVATAFPRVIRPGQTSHAQALLAPAADDNGFTYDTLNLLAPEDRSTRDLPPFHFGPDRAIARWVLPSTAFPDAPVVVVVTENGVAEKELWLCNGSNWVKLASVDAEPESVRLWALDPGLYYCTWFDAVRGYQSRGPLAIGS